MWTRADRFGSAAPARGVAFVNLRVVGRVGVSRFPVRRSSRRAAVSAVVEEGPFLDCILGCSRIYGRPFLGNSMVHRVPSIGGSYSVLVFYLYGYLPGRVRIYRFDMNGGGVSLSLSW